MAKSKKTGTLGNINEDETFRQIDIYQNYSSVWHPLLKECKHREKESSYLVIKSPQFRGIDEDRVLEYVHNSTILVYMLGIESIWYCLVRYHFHYFQYKMS